jgi:cytochrome o ubiquinol oxidase subunit 1
VTTRDAYWEMKQHPTTAKPIYQDIYVPKNTPDGLYLGGIALVLGFGMVWHIWLLVLVAFIAGIGILFAHTLSDDDGERKISAKQVEEIEQARLAA